MRDRHWRSLMKEVGVAFDQTSDDFTLEKMMDLQFPKFSDFIEELSSTANKEVAIELALRDIAAVWKSMEIDLVEYKGVYWKIRGTEELFQTLEDHAVNVSSMKASPFAAAFPGELDKWEKALSTISEVVDLVLGVQRQWMYLENIFLGEDIRKQLPAETTKFDEINDTWKRIMGRLHTDPNAQYADGKPHVVRGRQVLGKHQGPRNDLLAATKKDGGRFRIGPKVFQSRHTEISRQCALWGHSRLDRYL
jgi:dynein heavy chain